MAPHDFIAERFGDAGLAFERRMKAVSANQVWVRFEQGVQIDGKA